jgi:hypothetical protein
VQILCQHPPPPPQSPHVPSPHLEEAPNIQSPPQRPPPPPPSHKTTKPTPPNRSAQNNHAKASTSGPNTSLIGPSETPLGKKALEKPSAISNQQGKKLAENNISTPRTASKKSLEKLSAISKLQEDKLAKNKSSTPPTAGRQALKKPSSAISKQQEKEIAINKTSKGPNRKRSKRNTKENHRYMTNPKQFESDTEKNPWAMANPNYKFIKSLLSDGDLKKVAPFTRKLHTFYMQRGKLDDDSQIMSHFGRGPMHG